MGRFKLKIMIIQATETNKITINGSPIELESIYLRFEYFAKANGEEMEIAFYTYYDKEAYLNNLLLPTNIGNMNVKVKLQEGEMQSYETAKACIEKAFIENGYNIETI